MKGILKYIFLWNVFFSLCAQEETIHVDPTGIVRTHSGAQVGIFGDLSNNGTFDEQNGGEVGFYNQNREQQILGENRPVFYEMKIDVPQDLNLQVGADAIESVEFINGRVITPRNTTDISLDIFNDNAYTGSSNSNHVDGFTSREGTDNYVFPVGDDFRLRPIEIITNGNFVHYKAAYFYEDAAEPNAYIGTYDRNEKSNILGRISPYEFWFLDGRLERNEFQTVSATLTWDNFSNISDLLNGGELRTLRVAGWHRENQSWLDLGNVNFEGDLDEGKITSDEFNPNLYEVITIATIFNSGTEVLVYNGISSDGDGVNDYLIIGNIRNFPNNKLTIFNRWGVVVYDADNYDADDIRFVPNPKKRFDGTSTGRVTLQEDQKLPVGTYFYVFEYAKDNSTPRKTLSGYIYLNR